MDTEPVGPSELAVSSLGGRAGFSFSQHNTAPQRAGGERKMKRIFAFAWSVLFLSLASTAFAVDYQIVILSGLPGCYATTPESVNSSGQLVINSYFSAYRRAGIWQNGTVTPLLPLSGYMSTWACGINKAGQVVGSSTNSAGVMEACMWENGTVVDLGWSGDADDINDSCQIVGRGSDYTKAVLWENGSFTYLGTGEANAINNYGQVVGRDFSGNAVLWENGTTTILGRGNARDINDHGQVVGVSGNRACLWQNGTALLIGQSGGFANSINDSGQVVGYNIGGVWQNGVITQLPSRAGYYPYEGLYMSDGGQVLGWLKGINSGEISVLWTPIPEPSSLLSLLFGAGGLAGMARLRKKATAP